MTTLFDRERGLKLSAEECWMLLAEAISPDLHLRAELLSSKVAQHTVDALYPASFDSFGKQIARELDVQGASHLRLSLLSSRNWDRIVAISSQLRSGIRVQSEAFSAEFQAFDGAPIGEAVFAELYKWWDPDVANDYTHYYIAAIYATYWLTVHPEHLPPLNKQEADECAQWVVNSLLPDGSGLV